MARITKTAIERQARAERKLVRERKKTGDSYQNWSQSIGVGTNNALTGSTYGFNPITRIRTLLEWIYRGSWFGGMAIDIIADDMTRNGIDLRSTMPPDNIEQIDQTHTQLGVWNEINNALRWDRLYGGAINVFMIDGQDVSTPLNIERIGADQFKGLLTLDRWMVEAQLSDLVEEQGPDIGLPKFYRVTADAPAFRMKKIHYSRVIRYDGVKLPYWQRLMENLWGMSEFERLYDRMVAFDSATMGMAQLIYKAYIRTYRIKAMRKMMSESGQGEAALMRWVEMTRRLQGNEGITLIDAEDDFVPSTQTAFTGISDAVLALAQQLGGALQMPLTRMFGQSPGGLNSVGDNEMKMYGEGIHQRQEVKLRRGVDKLVRITARSKKIKIPDNFGFGFVPLSDLDEGQKSEIFTRDAGTIMDLEAAGIYDFMTALKELRQISRTTGRGTNITDEAIEDAKNAPPRPREGDEGGGDQEGDGGEKSVTAIEKKKSGDQIHVGGSSSGEVDFHGIPVVIEYFMGDDRFGRAIPADYGYIRRTGSAEGSDEQMDCFLAKEQWPQAFIIDSYEQDKFDEHKVMLGYKTGVDAVADFNAAYSGFRQAQNIRRVSINELSDWLTTGDVTKPYATQRIAA